MAYSYHYNNKLDGQIKKKADTETFQNSQSNNNSIKPDKEDEIIYQDMDNNWDYVNSYQSNTDNDDHQLYEYELKKFWKMLQIFTILNQKDGISNTEK